MSQDDVLRFLEKRKGYLSVVEINKKTGVSLRSINHALRTMLKHGEIKLKIMRIDGHRINLWASLDTHIFKKIKNT